jgi:hypothetical protein
MWPGVRAKPYHIDRPAPSASSEPSTCCAEVAAPQTKPSGNRTVLDSTLIRNLPDVSATEFCFTIRLAR